MKNPLKEKSLFSASAIFGLCIFFSAPLLLFLQSKYHGVHRYTADSRQLRQHYLQTTVDVFTDRVKRGGEYPEYSVLLIREFLHNGDKVSAEMWLRKGITDWRNPALADFYDSLIRQNVLTVPHPRSFRLFLKRKAEEFRKK